MFSNKKLLIIMTVITVCLLGFSGCMSDKMNQVAKELEGSVRSEVLEHKGSALGLNELPIWVETYILKGITGLEKLDDYEGDYCFVAETSSSNLNSAQMWVDNFSAPQTIARNVSTRVEGLFTGATSGSTDEYAAYFESVVNTIINTEFSGAKKENDWWLLTRRHDVDSQGTYEDVYRAFVLYTIPKDLLDQQVLSVINRIESESNLNVQETSLTDRVKGLIENSEM